MKEGACMSRIVLWKIQIKVDSLHIKCTRHRSVNLNSGAAVWNQHWLIISNLKYYFRYLKTINSQSLKVKNQKRLKKISQITIDKVSRGITSFSMHMDVTSNTQIVEKLQVLFTEFVCKSCKTTSIRVTLSCTSLSCRDNNKAVGDVTVQDTVANCLDI